jgi:hypothetical protein
MNTLIKSASALVIILALPVTSYAVGAEAQNPAHHTMHHHKGDYAEATALATPLGVVVAPLAPLPETDGLSRRDEDCKFGCIDH